MNKRNLIVPSEQKAIELMQAKLAEKMVDGVLEFADETTTSHPDRHLYLMRLSRDPETNEWIGCPCFVCDFNGKDAETGEAVHGIIYVKAFASQESEMTQIYFVKTYMDYGFDNIEEGECFTMHDEQGRFEDEDFVFHNGEITPL